MSNTTTVIKLAYQTLKPGIYLECPNILCQGRQWYYTGTRTVYATCPHCKKSIRIEDHKFIDAGEVGARTK